MTDQEKIILNEEKLLFTEFPYSMYVDNIFDSNINLKRNVFHTTSLIFSNSNKHQLILNNFENIRFSHLEIWRLIIELMPNINIKEMEGLHEDPLQHDKNEIFYFNNFHEDFVYKNCKIDDFSFSYLTDSFINNQLQSIIFKINKNSIIEFECYSDEEESSKIKFRYFGTKWQKEEYYKFLTFCLK